MDSLEALHLMVETSGKSRRLVSTQMGRHPMYLALLLHSGSCPQTGTYVSIARAHGCKVVVRLPNQNVKIDGWDVHGNEKMRLS